MKQYYFSNGQEPSGPFTLDEMSKHSFTPDSLVWYEGMSEWLPANELAEIRLLITVVPPPIRRTAQAGLPPIQAIPPPVPVLKPVYIAPPAANVASVAKARLKYYFLGGGALLLVIGVLFSGVLGHFFQSDSSYAASIETTTTETVGTSIMPDSSATNDAFAGSAQAQDAEQVQQQIAVGREQKRAWNREHFLEFFKVFINPNYSIGTFGGISDGSLTVQNNSGYRLENVTVDVTFYKPNGAIIDTKSV